MRKLFFFLFSLMLLPLGQLKAESQPASALWALTSATTQTCSLSGQLENAELTLNGLAVESYAGPSATITVMLAEGKTALWQTAEDPNRYIEFSVTPKSGNKFHAQEIAVYVCGKGGGNMRANFYYSTDPTFAQKTQIDYRKDIDLTRDNSAGYELLKLTIDETIEAGNKIYFRIYPYYKSAAAGKYICLKDATISGVSESTEISASVTWPFISDLKPLVSGALIATDMAYSTNSKQYGWDARVSLGGIAIANGTFTTLPANCAWTASAEPQEDIYVQYAVRPKTGATLTVKNIALMIAATGTNDMGAAIYGSKDETFASKTTLKVPTDLVNTELQAWDIPLATPEIVATGETYYVRIHPFHKTNATYKLVGVRNVTISGTMIGATVDPAEVNTFASATYISTTTALAGGTIVNDGGAAITARGMVWATAPNPTISDFKTVDGDGTGTFESTLTELSAGTTYYTRAYASNTAGTSYGNEISFTTLSELVIPTVTTSASASVRNTSFIVSGKVTDWGGSDVTERGIVLGMESNPTLANSYLVSGNGLGSFQVYFDGLTPETTYYVRAYASNSTGTAYGNEMVISTKATDPDVRKIVVQDGTGDYTSIQEAFDAVPADYTGKWIINLKPGTYNERPTLVKGKVNVYLIGEDALTTIITHNTYAGMEKPGGGTWGTSLSQTMAIEADDFMAVNITVANTFVNSKTNAAINANTQAVALRTQGDRQSFYNCRITGYQDTYLGNSIGRAYFKNCYIEGNVDFIFGRQTVVFDQCTTYVNRNGSVLTAPSTEKTTKYGMVFLDCDLTAPSTSYVDFNGDAFVDFYYGRPWQQQPKSAFIRCATPSTLNEKGWTTMNGGLSPIFVEYGCTGDGATAERLSKRANEGTVLTEPEASEYTVATIFKKATDPSFAADWMPSSVPSKDITSINTETVGDKLAQSAALPNPFSDEFTISYTLEKESNVAINLYNMNGVLLNKLTDTTQSVGNHSIQYNGSALSAGVYFYSIQTENGRENQKIIKK